MRGRFSGLTNDQWDSIRPLLPQQTKRVGRPSPDLRKVLTTILYVKITGCRWCDVPIGDQWAKRSTAHEWLGYLERYGCYCEADQLEPGGRRRFFFPQEKDENRILTMVIKAKELLRTCL